MTVADISNPGGLTPLKGAAPSKTQPAQQQPVKVEKAPADANEAAVKQLDRTEFDRIARQNAQLLDAAKLVLNALPDVRRDKVELARQRLKAGFYDQPEVRGEIARRLAADPEGQPTAPLTEARTETIKGRLATGFYDRPEVRAQIAREMTDEALEE